MRAEVMLLKQYQTKSLLRIVLREGRNRQIRRVATLLGHQVLDLKRIAIANFKIDGLTEGQWRNSEEKEWSEVLNKVHI